jgi:uncharacterized 2Fe-2S/4Fe-4S cluster protein (DUF4445 family)
MRATTGAITSVRAVDGKFVCKVAAGAEPRGICGSGVVDAIAAALDIGRIAPTGRIAGGAASIPILGPVSISQQDIREIQVAKAAIAAGVRILLHELGATVEQISTIHLAGAFGNYVNRRSAQRIGLLPLPSSVIHAAGNTALLGAKLALYDRDGSADAGIAGRVRHLSLNTHPRFQDIFVDEMLFPEETP